MERIYVNSLRNIEFKEGNVLFDLGEETVRDGTLTFEVRSSLILSVKDCGGVAEFLTRFVKQHSEQHSETQAIEAQAINEVADKKDDGNIVRVKIS
jgi:hypothetical protein